jgi:hypothetical protein
MTLRNESGCTPKKEMGAQASFFRIFFFGGAAFLKRLGSLDLQPEHVAAGSSVPFSLFSLGVSFFCTACMSTIEFSSVTLVCFPLHFADLTSACAFLFQAFSTGVETSELSGALFSLPWRPGGD